MEFSPQNVCGFLIRSRLMTPGEMRTMFERWQKEGNEHLSSLSHFTRWLVTNRYVTEYQAGLLAKGHGDPEVFFLNQYKILERIGRGRMAGVYKAIHNLGQTVAIKVLPPSRAKNPQMLARFQREALLAVRLKHPNVVRSFQIGEAAGLHYLVMEYLEGETLEDLLNRRRRLPPAEAVGFIHQALLGLQHIHEQGMIHRDLKPSNLMLAVAKPGKDGPETTQGATIKILDIGLARTLFEESTAALGDKAEITAEGVILGTPDYLAPEQARDPRNIDIRADIYSLGCVLYHLLSGQTPFPDNNVLNQMVRHASETPRPLQEFNREIPDGLSQIVGYMMAKQASQRYPTPGRAAQALEMFLLAGSQPPKAIEEAPQMRKFLTWLEMESTETQAVHIPAASPPSAAAVIVPSPPAPPPVVPPPIPAKAVMANTKPVAVPPPPGPPPLPSPPRQATPIPPTKPPAEKKAKKPKIPSTDDFPVALAIDVELVETEPVFAHRRAAHAGLSKRDWILIGASAGGVLFIVILVIILVAVL